MCAINPRHPASSNFTPQGKLHAHHGPALKGSLHRELSLLRLGGVPNNRRVTPPFRKVPALNGNLHRAQPKPQRNAPAKACDFLTLLPTNRSLQGLNLNFPPKYTNSAVPSLNALSPNLYPCRFIRPDLSPPTLQSHQPHTHACLNKAQEMSKRLNFPACNSDPCLVPVHVRRGDAKKKQQTSFRHRVGRLFSPHDWRSPPPQPSQRENLCLSPKKIPPRYY